MMQGKGGGRRLEMTRALIPVATLGLTLTCLACWLLMFAAGHDIWHDTGRLDVRTLGATAAA
jgi:hypothetical protein